MTNTDSLIDGIQDGPDNGLFGCSLDHASVGLKRAAPLDGVMADRAWENIYDLSDEQITNLDLAEEKMEAHDLNEAERILLSMRDEDPHCVPVLSNLGHLNGRYLSDFETAVEYYGKVLAIEPDNAWARDERRRYKRYSTYD